MSSRVNRTAGVARVELIPVNGLPGIPALFREVSDRQF